MSNIIKIFKYGELGGLDKTKSFELVNEEGENYTLKIRDDAKDYHAPKKAVNDIFNKYSFKNLTIDVAYPFPIKEQIDYRIEGYYLNPTDNFDINGYSHFPIFFNDFISDLARVFSSKNLFKFKVKEEMLDKDKSYKTNYIEKCSIYTDVGEIILTVDKLSTSNYEGDVYVEKLNNYFKASDLSFVLPCNVSFFTFLFNKSFKFSSKALKRNQGLINYIDVRLKNKKHRYFDLDDGSIKDNFTQLIHFLKRFMKVCVLDAFIDEGYVDKFLSDHKKPKTKAEVIKDFSDLINNENYLLIDALKKIARDNPNLDLREIVSIAYKLQDNYYVYLIDSKGIKEIKINESERKKKLPKYFNSYGCDLGFIDISKDYDAHYYEEDNLIHLKVVATRYPDLEYLKIDNKIKSLISSYFNL